MADPSVPAADDLAAALDQFRTLLDPAAVDALQAFGPAAVYTPWVVVWLLVYQRLHANAPLRDAVAELVGSADVLPAHRRDHRRVREHTLSANTAAYSQARSRLGGHVTDHVADHVCGTLVAAHPPSWRDRRVFTVDGTTVPLAPTAELRAAFPPATNQHGTSAWPVAQLVVAHELASGCAVRPEVGPMYGPKAVSEQALAERLLGRLPARSVVLGDRNFGVFGFAHAAVAAGHDVLLRLTRPRFRALVRSATAVGPGTWELAWRPSRHDRAAHPGLPADACVTVRLHAVTVSADLTLWLVTTLAAGGAELAALYRLRADVETDIRDVKVTLKLEEVRSRGVAMLGKELAVSTVAYNLVVQIRRLAAARAGVKPRRLSFTGVWSLVRVILLQPDDRTPDQWRQQFAAVLRGAGQRKLPHRPGRSYPREVIPRRRKHPERPRQPAEQPPK